MKIVDIQKAMEMPNRLSTAKSLLESRRLKSLYDSDKWEFFWNRSVERNWKRQRRTRYKG